MPTRTRTIRDVLFTQIEHRFELGAYYFGDRWCAAVAAKGDGYQIRVITGEKTGRAGTSTSYDYFLLDADGLILSSPRGYARDYTKCVRVTDIAEAAKRYAEPDPAATRLRFL